MYVPEGSPSSALPQGSYQGGRRWANLKGCLNDVEAMRELLVKKFLFKPENVWTLTDRDRAATREAIVGGIERLIAESSPGDVALFYYSGHGSQIINIKNGEEKRKDETIVPADSYRGAEDIRDKELARHFNRALDKGIILTAIFDSCHSGSICRGVTPLESGQARFLNAVRSEDREPPDPQRIPKPEERTDLKGRGILVLTAAQDNELAREAFDEEAPEGGRDRGAFSLALTRILAAVPENESVSRIFNRMPSTIQAKGLPQVPVISGTAERMAAPLFGVGRAGGPRGIAVAALRVEGDAVEIHGGSAVGLAAGCELTMEAAQGRPPVRIRVTEVKSLARSEAVVIAGSAAAVKPGSMFLVDKWAYSGAGSALKVWWPLSAPHLRDLEAVRTQLIALKSSGEIVWIDDPTEDTPDWIVGHDGRAWVLKKGSEPAAELSQPFRAQEILDAVRAQSGRRPKIFVAVPAPSELVGKLALGPGKANDALIRTEQDGEADYALVGRLGEGGVEVAWVAPGRVKDQVPTPLPVRSDWEPVTLSAESSRAASDALEKYAQQLQWIKGWLCLRSMDEGVSPFPYHLAFKKEQADNLTPITQGPLHEGERYELVLVRDGLPADSRSNKVRIYVFAIDSWGAGQILFPNPNYGEIGNTLDRLGTGRNIVLRDEAGPFQIGPPFGYDAYFLLTSEEPILEDLKSAFKSGGVRTRGEGFSQIKNPLVRLFMRGGSSYRGDMDAPPAVPSRWTIDHYVVKSVPAK